MIIYSCDGCGQQYVSEVVFDMANPKLLKLEPCNLDDTPISPGIPKNVIRRRQYLLCLTCWQTVQDFLAAMKP